MSNSGSNNQFLIDIQETEAKAEKLKQSALEKKHKQIAAARAKAETEKQTLLSETRTKNQRSLAIEKEKLTQSNTKLIEQHQAETEKFTQEKLAQANDLCAEAFENLLQATA